MSFTDLAARSPATIVQDVHLDTTHMAGAATGTGSQATAVLIGNSHVTEIALMMPIWLWVVELPVPVTLAPVLQTPLTWCKVSSMLL
jgi:hypothetical protein